MPIITPQLPQALHDAAADERTSKAISWIAQRWKLKNVDEFFAKGAAPKEALDQSEVAKLSQTIGEVLEGMLHPNFVVKTLQERLQIPQERARDIAHDVSREIFSRVRRELMEYYRITPQQKIAHPAGQKTTVQAMPQTEPMKPSMRPEESGIRNQETEIRDQGTGDREQGQVVAEPPTQPEDRGKPSLAEQVEEIADSRGLNADLRGPDADLRGNDADLRGNETPAEKEPQAPEPTVPAPEPPSLQKEPKPPEPFDDTQGKHFEPGPEQVIDLR